MSFLLSLVNLRYTGTMKLLVALGNPEPKYDNTRHNIGFFVADTFATAHGLTWQNKSKFKATVAEGKGFVIAKPATYYNLVGESARAICDFYKISPHDVLIIHDDLALPLGTIRTRHGGSPAGNNGIKSITQHLGDTTARLRIGTHTEHRDTIDDATFVLNKFSTGERAIIDEQLPKITEFIESFLHDTFETTTHK